MMRRFARAHALAAGLVLTSVATTGCVCGDDPNGTATSTITSPTDGQVIAGSPLAISGTASADQSPLAKVEVSFDDGNSWHDADGLASWTYSLTAADGQYTVISRASNEAGAVETPLPGVTFTLDNTAPAVVVTSTAPNAIVVGYNHTLQGTASDSAGVADVQLSFDSGATWVLATGTSSWSFDWGPFTSDGLQHVLVRATDAVGNASAPVDLPVTIDRELPTSSISSPAANEWIRGSTRSINGFAQSMFGTVSQVQVSADDGASWVTATGTNSWSYSWTVPADGTVHLRSRATDLLGGVEAVAPQVTVKVDNTGPNAAINTPAQLAVRGLSLGLLGTSIDPTATDGTASGVLKVEFSSDDGATWTTATGLTAWSFNWGLPSDGTYLLKARAQDVAGNVGLASASLSIIVDNTKPTSTVTLPAPASTVAGTTINVTGNAADNLAGVQLVEVSTNGGGSFSPATGTTAWSFSFNPSANGIHDIRVRVTDVAGNVDATTQRLFIVDNDIPTCVVANPPNGASISGTTFSVTGSSSDGTSGVEEVWFSSDNGGTWALAAGTTTWSYSFQPPANGAYALRCKAVDRAANSFTSGASNITVDLSLPSSQITSPSNGAAFQATSWTITGTANSNSLPITLIEVSRDSGGTWQPAICDTCGSPGSVSWHYDWTTIAEGTYVVMSRARNSSSLEPTSPQVTVKVDRTKPLSSLTSHASNSSVRGTTVTLTGSASDNLAGVQLVEISFNDGSTYVPVTSGTTSWTYDWTLPSDSTVSIRTRATDLAGNLEVPSSNVVIKVDNTAPSSALSQPANNANLTGPSFLIQGTASDNLSGLDRVEVSIDDGNTWVTATGTVVWNYLWILPSDGTYTIRSRAVDNAGNQETAAVGRTVKVDNSGPTAVITNPVVGQNIKANTYSVQGTASDGTGAGVQKVEVSTDNGANWNNATGTTSWSYSWTTPGDSTPTLLARATDNVNIQGPNSAAVGVRIDKSAPSSNIISPSNGVNLTGAGTTISGLATDTGSGLTGVEVSLDGSTWVAATLVGNSWSYSWTFGADATLTIRSRATDAAGNQETAQPGNTVKVDNTPPSTTITAPLNGSNTNLVTYTITGTYSDGAGAGVTGVQVSTDSGANWAAATLTPPSAWSYSWTTPADGPRTVQSRATDGVGLIETAAAGNTVQVDKTKPSSSISTPVNNTNLDTSPQLISGSSTDPAPATGVQKVEISTDSGANWSNATGTTSWSYSWTLPGVAGAYGIRTRATDVATNLETFGAGFTYHVLPKVTSVSPSSVAAGDAVDLNGVRFGATKGASTVTFNGVAASIFLSWSDTRVRVAVPATATTGNVLITVNGETSNPVTLTVVAQPATGPANVVANGGKWTSLKLGSDGLPRIAHVASNTAGGVTNNRTLMFSQYSAGAWATANIRTTPNGTATIQYVSLAIDPNDANHLTWYEAGDQNASRGLWYATCSTACTTAGNWTTVNLLPNGLAAANLRGQYSSIGVDGANRPRITFYDGTNPSTCTNTATRCLRYAFCNGACTTASNWTYEEVPPLGGADTNWGQWSALAIDTTGTPHVGYQVPGQFDANYATKVSGIWNSLASNPGLGNGNYNGIAVNPNNLPRLVDYDDDTNNGTVWVSMFTGIGFTKCKVDENFGGIPATNASNIAIAVGNDDVTRVVFNRNGDLRLRTQVGSGTCTGATTWTNVTIGASGTFASLALDAVNRARVAQLNGTSLQYYAQP